MKEQLSHFCMHVKDMEKAVSFYKDKLGFEVLYQNPDWSELQLNDKVILALHKTESAGSGIGYGTDDCEKATKELEERGVKIITRCQKREKDGIILTQFDDMDGNVIWL